MTTTKLFDLSGNVAIITGGNRGLGRSIAIGLAKAGASVAIFGRNDSKNKSALSELREIGVPSIRYSMIHGYPIMCYTQNQ